MSDVPGYLDERARRCAAEARAEKAEQESDSRGVELTRLRSQISDNERRWLNTYRRIGGLSMEQSVQRALSAEKALADSKAEVEAEREKTAFWTRKWNGLCDDHQKLRARVASQEGALREARELADHRNPGCNPNAAYDVLNVALELAQPQPPAPNGNTPCGECSHPLRCHHPDLPQCSASPDCRCRGWSAQPPAEVRTAIDTPGGRYVVGSSEMRTPSEPPSKADILFPDDVRTEPEECPACGLTYEHTNWCSVARSQPAQPTQGVAGNGDGREHMLTCASQRNFGKRGPCDCIEPDPDTLPTLSDRLRDAYWKVQGGGSLPAWWWEFESALGLTPPAKEGT